MDKKQTQNSKKITKVSLVIYFIIALVCLGSFLAISFTLEDNTFIYSYLLCLGPSILFVLISVFLPTSSIVDAKMGKGVIALYIIAYIVKYAAIIGIPFIGLTFKENFNNWVMLATTLIAPIFVIIYKLIFANYVSKEAKNTVK